jgi:competence protein ComEC
VTSSRVFLYFCLFFLSGVALESFVDISRFLSPGFLISGIFLISLFWRNKKTVVFGFCFLFLALGIWRCRQAEGEAVNNQLAVLTGQEVVLTGRVAKEPDIREDKAKLTVKTDKGDVLITISLYPRYQYGDNLNIQGKLETPQDLEDFNYQGYLAKDHIYAVMYQPKIELLSKGSRGFYSWLLLFKVKFRQSIYENLSPPQSAILAALVLGDNRQMPEGLKTKFNITGIRHITAVSGMHIMILAGVLMNLAGILKLKKKLSFCLAMILLILFTILVSSPASAVRALIMGGFFLLAKALGRQNTALRSIILSAALMLGLNPLLLKFDVGFQLSFLAVLGMIYFSRFFKKQLKFEPLATVFAAQVFTLPILIYNFGSFSLIAPLANILIVPLSAPLMILGLLGGLAGIALQPLGWILALPSWLLLTYWTKVVDWLALVPLALIPVENFPWALLFVFYFVLGFWAWREKRKEKEEFLNY